MSRDLLRRERVSSLVIREEGRGPSGELVVTLEGSIDADGAPALSRALEELLVRGDHNLALDFAGISFISSSGIGALIAAVAEHRDEGGDIVLRNVGRAVMDVFTALDLLDYVTLG